MPEPTPELSYRDCVGVVLLNDDGLVFVGKRRPKRGEVLSHHWQMPQGGVDDGETPIEAARRELREETGVSSVELLREMPEWLTYDLPAEMQGWIWGGYHRGQRQRWFCFRFTGPEAEIDLDSHHGKPEFTAWRWVPFEDLGKLVVPFKRAAYRSIVAAFGDLGT